MNAISPSSPIVLQLGMGMLVATSITTALFPGHLPYIGLLGLFLFICIVMPKNIITKTARKVLALGVGVISAISHSLLSLMLTIL